MKSSFVLLASYLSGASADTTIATNGSTSVVTTPLVSSFTTMGSVESPSTKFTPPAQKRMPLFLYVRGGVGSSAQTVEREFEQMAANGVTNILLGFYTTSLIGSSSELIEMAGTWRDLGHENRARIQNKVHGMGTKVLLSAGGNQEDSRWLTLDSKTYGRHLCTTAKELDFDGVDFNLAGINDFTSAVAKWLHESAAACKEVFPNVVLTSSPQSSYLNSVSSLTGGEAPHGWADILVDGAKDGSAHDHILVRYFNQGNWFVATDYNSLYDSKEAYSISSLMRRYPNASADSFVVGKPLVLRDGEVTDWVDLDSMREYGCRAWNHLGWRGGFMLWQHHFGADRPVFDSYARLTAPCPLETQNPSASTPKPFLKRAGGMNAPIDDLVQECVSRVVGEMPSLDQGCRNLCVWYGHGGMSQCGHIITTFEELSTCVITLNPWCRFNTQG